MKVLLVDDEKDILHLLKEWLEAEEFEVFLASNGKEFREQALQQKPDVIILDINLGGENGVSLYDKLLLEGLNPKTPVIFLSGLAHSHQESHAHPGRHYALRTKPFNPYELVKDIRCMAGETN